VRTQRYKDGGVTDAKVFSLAEGLSWTDTAGRAFNVAAAEMMEWMGIARRREGCREGGRRIIGLGEGPPSSLRGA
jgi:hypothetical protein